MRLSDETFIEMCEKTGKAVNNLDARIKELEALVEAAYHEGVRHGESSACAYEWGAASSKYDTWEHSDAKEALAKVSVATK